MSFKISIISDLDIFHEETFIAKNKKATKSKFHTLNPALKVVE